MPSVLITGGSGFLGINLVRHFLSLGWKVSSIDKEPFDYPELEKIQHVHADIRDQHSLKAAMQNVDFVVHTAAALPLNTAKEIFSVEVNGTQLVTQAAVDGGVKRFVHISSTAVYGVPDHHPLFETDELIGVGPYGNAKIQAEAIAEARRQDILVTILRPKSFIGPERLGVFALLFDWAADGLNFPIPGGGANLYQYLDVHDLCVAIELALRSDPEDANETYNIGAESFGTFRDDFQSVLDLAGFGKRIVSFPAMPAIWLLRGLNKFGLSPLYPWVYETAVKDSFVSIDKAKLRLGYSPRYSNKHALARNFEWYLENRQNFEGVSGKTHRVPWKQGALGLARFVMRLWT